MPEESRRHGVLVADDSRFFRSMLSYALGEDGFQSFVAASGDELLEVLREEGPRVDLLLLDLVMPGKNGFAVLEELRARSDGRELPVIVITQYALNPLEREILKKHGVVTVLSKASSIERILFEVRAALFPGEREARSRPRQQASLAVTVKGGASTRYTTTYNLSESGMFLVMAEDDLPAKSSDVTVKFWIPDEASVFELGAKVVWVNVPGPDFRRSHPPGFGIHYSAPPERVVSAIRSFLARA